MAKGQVDALLPLLEGQLAREGLGWADLSRLVVGIGPGNFTGSRIGVAAARALSLATGVEAVGLSTLAALAFDVPGKVTALVPAPLDQVYAQQFCDGLPQGEVLLQDHADLSPGAAYCADPAQAAEMPVAVLGVPFLPERLALAVDRVPPATLSRPPAPLYVKPAGAKPASDPPPVILPGPPG